MKLRLNSICKRPAWFVLSTAALLDLGTGEREPRGPDPRCMMGVATKTLLRHTCELFFTAIAHTLLQTLQLVLHLFVLSLRLLALSPTNKKERERDKHMHPSVLFCFKESSGLP